MAASFTVPQLSSDLNSPDAPRPLTPTRGIVTLFGYGICIRVDRGHLIVEDGIGPMRRHAWLPRHARTRALIREFSQVSGQSLDCLPLR